MDSRASALEQFRLAWAVDKADGPASRWPILVPKPGLEWCCGDMRGMGVPAESLPLGLSAFSVNGWTLALDASGIRLEPGAPDPRTGVCSPKNAEGCRRYLELNRDSVTKTWLAWQALLRTLAQMEALTPAASPAPKPAPRRRAVEVSNQRWARYA